jgi:integrase
VSVRRSPDPRYPGKPWLAEVYSGGRRTRRRFGTRAEASAFEVDSKRRLVPRGIEEAVLKYLNDDVPRLRESRQPKVHAKAIREAIRGKTFDDVPEVVTAIKAGAAGKSAATLNRRLALLRRVCRLAEEWGWIVRAPRIRLVPEQPRETWLTAEQVEALAARMPRCGDIVRLAAYTGLRRRELLELTADSVRGHTLAVATLKQRQRKIRMVPVPPRCHALLKGIPWRVTNQILRDEWEAARKAEGLQAVRLHDIRHFYGSLLAELGTPDRTIMELMGHTDPRMVARYSHLRPEHLARVVEGL